MTRSDSLNDREFFDYVCSRVQDLDAAEREALLQRFAMMLAGGPSARFVREGSVHSGTSNDSVVLCDWAQDGGTHEMKQRIEVDMLPGSTKIAKTQASTGRPLLSNGFLGADLIHVPAGEGFAPHTHQGDHMLFVVGGRGTITANGEILETRTGQVYMVDGLQPHAVGAISDHVLLSVGIAHKALDSENRQTLTPFSDLLTAEGVITCRICGITADSRAGLTGRGCSHAPVPRENLE